jgi:hypothetical protein
LHDTTVDNDRRPDLATFQWDDLVNHYSALLTHVEVKVRNADGPEIQDGNVKNICRQVANVSRAHLALRPFQLYSLNIMICGLSFWCSIWDRSGAVISREYSIIDSEEEFVRLVLQLSGGLSETELGADPTVEMKQRPSSADSAVYNIVCGTNTWQTESRLFQSPALVGRGTSVWVVSMNTDTGKTRRVMKMAWRAKSRASEGEIYNSVRQTMAGGRESHWPKGVGQLELGGDVTTSATQTRVTRHIEEPIYVSWIRHGVGRTLTDIEDVILHRLILTEVGRPIWEYTSSRELLQGFRDAIGGMKSVPDFFTPSLTPNTGHRPQAYL